MYKNNQVSLGIMLTLHSSAPHNLGSSSTVPLWDWSFAWNQRNCIIIWSFVTIITIQATMQSVFTENGFAKCSQAFVVIFFIQSYVWQKEWTLAHRCLRLTEPFEAAPLMTNQYTVACYQWTGITVKWSKKVFYSIPQQVFCCPCPNLVKHVAAIESHNKHIFTNIIEVDKIEHQIYCIFTVFQMSISKGLTYSLTFCTTYQFLELGL